MKIKIKMNKGFEFVNSLQSNNFDGEIEGDRRSYRLCNVILDQNELTTNQITMLNTDNSIEYWKEFK